MPVFSITFDLIKRRDYQTLWVELERLKAQRLLLSHWGVHMAADTTAMRYGITSGPTSTTVTHF